MKRSSINLYIAEATEFFSANRFALPPFAHWTPEMWALNNNDVGDICSQRLGWDVTDFKRGQFEKMGLTLFTLRNAGLQGNVDSKTYAEKIMYVRENQVTPFHFHVEKTEDIINRGVDGTGKLSISFHNSKPDGTLDDTVVWISSDGVERRVEAGGTVVLGHGESLTVPPNVYHSFHAIEGAALIGEISSRNDDDFDNYFLESVPRFPEIEEDEPPIRLLCTEYPQRRRRPVDDSPARNSGSR